MVMLRASARLSSTRVLLVRSDLDGDQPTVSGSTPANDSDARLACDEEGPVVAATECEAVGLPGRPIVPSEVDVDDRLVVGGGDEFDGADLDVVLVPERGVVPIRLGPPALELGREL